MASAKTEQAVIVTTSHRGVFFGYTTEDVKKIKDNTISLVRARNCVYWSEDCKGFVGLASTGPTKSCRIGPAADMTLYGITAVLMVSDVAKDAWEAAPWKS